MCSTGHTPQIHVIDDDPQSIQVLGHILKKKGYKVMSSLSGAEALEQLLGSVPDLILLDVIMPEMDGYQVCKKIKDNPQWANIPVIFITASHHIDELVKGFDAGAVDFISKPLNKSELLARVNTHLDLKQSRDMIHETNQELREEIEKRKQTEEKFKALSETTFEAIVFLQDQKIIEANKTAIKLLGLKSLSDNHPDLSVFTNEKGRPLLKKILTAQKGEGPWEIDFYDKNKQHFHAQIQHQPFTYKGKDVNVIAIRDITRQKEIDKEILNAIVETEDRERKRFSRDLHDGLGALLSTLKIYITLFQKENKDAAEKQALLEEMKDTIHKAIEAARTIANNIMPNVLMDHGLIKGLKSFGEALTKTGTIQIHLDFPEKLPPMQAHTETHIYKIILELINNTLKHAQAQNIDLSLHNEPGLLRLKYQDDGKGFDFQKVYAQKQGGQGLKNILSRMNFIKARGGFQNHFKTCFEIEIPVRP